MADQNLIKPISFTELDGVIGDPVWDKNVNRWRVLVGYRRYEDNREVIFTDSKGMESWESVVLYREKVKDPQVDVNAIREGMAKKDFRERCFG